MRIRAGSRISKRRIVRRSCTGSSVAGSLSSIISTAKGEQGSQVQELLACLRVHYLNLRLQAKNFRGIHSVNAGGGVGARAKQELSNSDTNEKSLILHRMAAFSLCTRFQQHRGGEIPCSKV